MPKPVDRNRSESSRVPSRFQFPIQFPTHDDLSEENRSLFAHSRRAHGDEDDDGSRDVERDGRRGQVGEGNGREGAVPENEREVDDGGRLEGRSEAGRREGERADGPSGGVSERSRRREQDEIGR